MKKSLLIILFLLPGLLFAQKKELSFPIFDGAFEYMTINQSDDLYISSYELVTDLFFDSYLNDFELGDTFKERIYNITPLLSLMMVDSLILSPLSHEEAHRSVLTAKGIGSISQPIIKFTSPLVGVAYVKGVRDAELKNLRDTDFTTFIRMHTAGLESDYSICQKEFAKLVFTKDDCSSDTVILNPFFIEYLMRDINTIFYEMNAKFGGLKQVEEENELERDIVGDDVCGMIHHLFNPTAEYHRYYTADDFSEEEKKFVNRIFYKTMLNFPIISPLLFRKASFDITNDLQLSFNTGYSLAPFGDYLDENIYLRIKKVLNGPLDVIFTARQYQNKDNWFPEFNLRCEQFSPLNWLTLNAGVSCWWQPEDFNFMTDNSFFGGSVEIGCNIYPFKALDNAKYEFGINLNCMYKTKGFIPEVMSLEDDFVFTAGISLRY